MFTMLITSFSVDNRLMLISIIFMKIAKLLGDVYHFSVKNRLCSYLIKVDIKTMLITSVLKIVCIFIKK